MATMETDEYVIFAHSLDATFDGIAIDDLHYEDLPSCRRPSNLRSSNINPDSTEINWLEKERCNSMGDRIRSCRFSLRNRKS